MNQASGKYILPFFTSLKEVLEQFGVQDIDKENLNLKDKLSSEKQVNINVGLVDDLQGNVSYGMSQKTVLEIVGMMMGGQKLEEIDEIVTSGLSEMANMAAGGATVKLSEHGLKGDISPPTIILGNDLYIVISQVQTVTLTMKTGLGPVQIDVALEQIRN